MYTWFNTFKLLQKNKASQSYSPMVWTFRIKKWNNETVLMQAKQGVQGLQAFACDVVTINDEHMKPRFKIKLTEFKLKDDICTKLGLNLWFESDWHFCNIAESGWFWKQLFRNKVPNSYFQKVFPIKWLSISFPISPEYHCFKVQTHYLVEKILHWTRWISDQTSNKTFIEKNQDFKSCVALKTIWSYCTLINIKLRKAHVYQHPVESQQFLKST